ncbi:MAG: 1-acyl-sn-glycerol-3-phosphate acyltransferase [Paludibacteraceae bacterium]|nr:1-acyl-sn-glycerol-3-phosphate acyltransferase [Candidatus Physcocola equi]MCQ2233616.1 1-acyl-sn-glycerol-3-phosphate acyltransferase [Paludibacteraceae bacterium]
MKKLSKLILKLAGWKAYSNVEVAPKCVFCVAPHTSNWDFWIGKLAYSSMGGVRPNFLIKKEWFRFPFNLFFGPMGGIPVNRGAKSSLTEAVIEEAKKLDRFQLAITPEGTRSANHEWKRGFYFIAKGANIPLYIVALDFGRKEAYISHEYKLTDDPDADLKAIQQWYIEHDIKGCHPEKFKTAE